MTEEESLTFNDIPLLPSDHEEFDAFLRKAVMEALSSIEREKFLSGEFSNDDLARELRTSTKGVIDVSTEALDKFNFKEIIDQRRQALSHESQMRITTEALHDVATTQQTNQQSNQKVHELLAEGHASMGRDVRAIAEGVARVDAKFDSKVERVDGDVRAIAEGLARVDAKFDSKVERVEGDVRAIAESHASMGRDLRFIVESNARDNRAMIEGIGRVDAKVDRVETSVNARVDRVEKETDIRVGHVETRLESIETFIKSRIHTTGIIG